MKLKKIFATAICLTIVAVVGAAGVQAASSDYSNPPVSTQSSDGEIQPRIDVIVRKYRYTDDGRIQYRRWNETRGYWVDPDWIDLYP